MEAPPHGSQINIAVSRRATGRTTHMPVDSLRVVVFSNAPRQGFALQREILRSLGHTLVGVVTTPGPASGLASRGATLSCAA